MMKCILGALFFCLFLNGCSSGSVNPDDPDAHEIQSEDSKIVDTPDTELFEKGKSYFESGSYNAAKEAFSSLRDSYPFSPYTELAQIRLAEIEFEKEKFDAAALLFTEVLKKYPASTRREYLMMQIARSHHLAYRGAGRDIDPIKKALNGYETVLRAYPKGKYSQSAREYAREAGLALVEHERLIMDFYRDRGEDKAYEARKKLFAEKWQPLLDDLERQEASDKSTEQEPPLPSQPEIITSKRQQSSENTEESPTGSEQTPTIETPTPVPFESML